MYVYVSVVELVLMLEIWVSLRYEQTNRPKHAVLGIDEAVAQMDSPVPEKGKQPSKSASKDKEHPQSNKGPLVQATISTLFKKAGVKVRFWFQWSANATYMYENVFILI